MIKKGMPNIKEYYLICNHNSMIETGMVNKNMGY